MRDSSNAQPKRAHKLLKTLRDEDFVFYDEHARAACAYVPLPVEHLLPVGLCDLMPLDPINPYHDAGHIVDG